MARGSVIFPAPEFNPGLYYPKEEVDKKFDYLVALSTNNSRLVYTNTATISKDSGWSATLPDTVDYVKFDGEELVRGGGSIQVSRSVFYNGDLTITGRATVTFAANGTLSAARFSLSGSSYQQSQFGSASYTVQGYHYITLKDFEG